MTVTYFSVETAGTTTADLLGGGPSLPEGYGGGSAQIYDISTTAAYSEPVTVCIDYDPADFGGGTPSVRLLHFDGELWLDVTTLNNPFSTPARVCSNVVEGFSPLRGRARLVRDGAGDVDHSPAPTARSAPRASRPRPAAPRRSSSGSTSRTRSPSARIDGDPFFFCESPLTVGPLEEGDHEFLVQAINEFGWMDLTPALYEWEILGPDVTPPTTVITNGPPEGSSTPNFISIFEFTGTDDFTPALELDFECTLDGEDLGGCETLEEIEVLDAGPHTLVVQAIDAAGNIDPVGADAELDGRRHVRAGHRDHHSGPRRRRPRPARPSTFEGFELLNDDAGQPVRVRARRRRVRSLHLAAHDRRPARRRRPRLPRARGRPRRQPGHLAGLLRVADHRRRRTRRRPTRSSSSTRIPRTPAPTSPSASPATSRSRRSSARGAAGTPPAAPTTWEECETVWLLEGLGSGQHWLWVRAIDAALEPNVDPTPAGQDRGFGPNDTDPFVWTTTGEPETIIDSGPADPTGAYTAIFEFHSDQPGATFQCSVNGSPYVGCSSGYQAGPFLPGEAGEPEEHEFEVRAVNQYRNADGEQVVDLSPATYTWTVQDVTPPETYFLGADGDRTRAVPRARPAVHLPRRRRPRLLLRARVRVRHHQHDRAATPSSGRSAASPRRTTRSSTTSRTPT